MIANGMTVRFHYRLRVDGEVVDDTRERGPMTFIHGRGYVIRGIEKATLGMKPGETKEVEIPPEDGYGPRRPDSAKILRKSEFGHPEKLAVGQRVGGKDKGHPFQATITEIGEDTVTLDMNHPLAGKSLHFEIEIVEVEDSPPKRIPWQRRKR
jgi:FKBP-type peptidyl-prolyl cis-trans isomerase SlyD